MFSPPTFSKVKNRFAEQTDFASTKMFVFGKCVLPIKTHFLYNLTFWGGRIVFYVFNEYLLMKPTKLENSEHIEQLRLLENRIVINAVEVEDDGISVDTPDDLLIIREQYSHCFKE